MSAVFVYRVQTANNYEVAGVSSDDPVSLIYKVSGTGTR